MQQPEETNQTEEIYQPSEREQNKLSLWLMRSFGLIAITIFVLIAAGMVYPMLPSSDNKTVTDNITVTDNTTSKESTLTEDINGIAEGALGKHIQILNTKDDATEYRIDIGLSVEPDTLIDATKLSGKVCVECVAILEEHGIPRNVSVWAHHSDTIYGRTYYNQDTDNYTFQKPEDIDQ